MKTQILKIFANNPFESFNYKQIATRVGAHDKHARQNVMVLMQQMAEDNILVDDPDHRGKLKLNPIHLSPDLLPESYITGVIDMKQGGKAYVIPDGDDAAEDIQIAPNNTNHALHGDHVKVLLFPRRKMRKPEGQVVQILQRARTRFVGTIQKQERFAFLVSGTRTMQVDIFIPLTDLNGADDGERVVAEITDWPERMNNPVGRVVKRLGRPGDNNVEMQSILAEYDFPLDFPPEAEREASALKAPTLADLAGRRDFRNVTTFTIDPADAKDFDDAISFRILGEGRYEVGVHIADVSHYVKPGTAIDREAYQRGTSVYLVDRTVPMLPERLCNDLCSLKQDEDKLCFSAVFELDDEAQVHNQWFGKTVICSNRRYAYEEAQQIIDSGTATDLPGQAVLQLNALASKLRSRRYADGAINFETQEVKFQLDENAHPIGVYIREDREANWLVEEFMLLANRCVAAYIGDRHGQKSPAKTFVYRVHDEPNPEKLDTFVQFVAKLGYKMKLGSRKTLAKSYNSLFEKIAGRGEEAMIDSIAIRTMAKAKYSTQNIGHYGLGFKFYTHFTSPIRRYPDLMVHRLLERYMQGGQSVSSVEYEDYCEHCSVMEKRAADAERASIKYKQAEFLADKIGQVFPALISGVSKWGIYAEIEQTRCEGMIAIGSLKDDYYMLDEDNYQVIGRRYGRTYKLGFPVQIKVKRVDLLKKQIDFELVDEAFEPKADKQSKKARRQNKAENKAQTKSPKSKSKKKSSSKTKNS
ncbi:MAG: ribonuclease R [Bacteroidales bacterium]|nr:ribonuclease R [Bacteroidales bacterium]